MTKPVIAYVYFSDLHVGDAHATQMLHSVGALSKHAHIIFITARISAAHEQRLRDVFSLPASVFLWRLPVWWSGGRLSWILHGLFVFLTVCLLRRLKPECIYTSDFGFLYVVSCMPAWLRPKAPIIFEQHKIYHKASTKVTYVQEQRALSVAHGIVANSKGVCEDLYTYFSYSQEHVLVLPNAAPMYLYTTSPDRVFLQHSYGFHPDEYVVVYSGSFLPWKGVEVLVRAAAYITTQKTKILLLGGVGKYRNNIEELIRKEGVGHIVHVGDVVEPRVLARVLCSADVGVIPNSKTAEGMYYTSPLKLFEYMASGLPIVAARLPALEDLLQEGRNCCFFEPEDARALAYTLDALLADTPARERMRVHNRLDVTQYSYETRAQRMFAFITQHIHAPHA